MRPVELSSRRLRRCGNCREPGLRSDRPPSGWQDLLIGSNEHAIISISEPGCRNEVGVCPLFLFIRALARDADLIGRIRIMAERVAASYGLDIFDVRFRREAHGMVLRVQIDRPGPAATAEESVSVDDCASMSRELSAMLDVEDVV